MSSPKSRLECCARDVFATRTVPSLLLDRAKTAPGRVALRKKDLGVYQEISWGEYRNHVEAWCLGLIELGLARGDRVAVLGDGCPEWLYCDLAVQSAGGVGVGIYPTCSPSEIRHIVEDSGAKFLMAQSQEHVDKALKATDQLPCLERIVVLYPRAMAGRDDRRLIAFGEVEERGRQRASKDPVLLEKLVQEVRSHDVAAIIYTSGSTGAPRGAAHSHRSLIHGSAAMLDAFPELRQSQQRLVALLPMVQPMERAYSVILPLMADFVLHFGENVNAVQETTFEVSPTFICAPPRFWQMWAAQTLTSIEASSRVKKAAFRWGMSVGRSYVAARWEHKKAPLTLRLLRGLAHWMVFRPTLDKMGLARLRFAGVMGAPISPQTIALWQAWGVGLREGYSLAEASGPVLLQMEELPRPGNAGRCLPGYDVSVAGNGELLVDGPAISHGYWQDRQFARGEAVDQWLHTGDAVQFANGENLKIVDRMSDIAAAHGKNISPVEIEKALKSSAYISEAAVFVDAGQFVTALVEINFDSVSEWASGNAVLHTSYASLVEHPRVKQLIQTEVDRVNVALDPKERVKKFRILPQGLDPEEEGDPVTPNRKIRRRQMHEKFGQLFESMCADYAVIPSQGGELEKAT